MALREALEATRSTAARDRRFLQTPLYFFELVVPPAALPEVSRPLSGNTGFLYPLVYAPQTLDFDIPFTTSMSVGGDGGLVVEENGTVGFPIVLTGTCGFSVKPHAYPAQGASIAVGRRSIPEERAFWSIASLSGQRHMEMLRDRVFHAYGDLKRDPATAAGTRLIWHNLKDNEHWLVIPNRFTVSRAVPNRTTSAYRIEMLAVAPASAALVLPEIGGSLSGFGRFLKAIKDAVKAIKSVIAFARSAINDIISFIGEIERAISDVISCVRGFIELFDAASALVGGAVDLILYPLKQVTGLLARAEQIERTFYSTVVSVPEKFKSAWRNLTIAAEALALFPDKFTSGGPTGRAGSPVRRGALVRAGVGGLQQGLVAGQETDLQAAKDEIDNSARRLGDLGASQEQFVGLKLVTVLEVDTIQQIGQRHGVPWQDVAAVNQLVPPYLSAHGEPGTLSAGSTIAVPTREPTPSDATVPAVVGVRPDRAEDVRLFGEDWLLVLNDDGTLGFPLNADLTDSLTVSGVDNLVQAMHCRARTGLGEDPLFPELGVTPVIGSGSTEIDLEMSGLRLTQSIASDPRIASASNVSTQTAITGDTLDAEITAVVRGLREPITTRASFPR